MFAGVGVGGHLRDERCYRKRSRGSERWCGASCELRVARCAPVSLAVGEPVRVEPVQLRPNGGVVMKRAHTLIETIVLHLPTVQSATCPSQLVRRLPTKLSAAVDTFA